MKKVIVMLALLGVVFAVTACNMYRGAGKDVSNAGDAMQDAGKK